MQINNPTPQQIEEAREYVRRRVAVQSLIEYELSHLFSEAAERIASIIIKYKERNMPMRFKGSSSMALEIDAVIRWLEDEIKRYTQTYACPEEASTEEEEEILDKVFGEDHGATFEERLALYISMYVSELSGVDFDILEVDEEMIESIISETEEKVEKRMSILALNSVALGYVSFAMNRAISGNAIGFFVINGSRPCEFCKQMSMKFHKITDPLPLYHPHCQCAAVFVYV